MYADLMDINNQGINNLEWQPLAKAAAYIAEKQAL